MTIFMGIKTKDYVFTAIDTKTTKKNKAGQITGYNRDDRKMYWLDNYNIGFATTGAVMRGPKLKFEENGIPIMLPGLKIGSHIMNELNNLPPRLYQDVIYYIRDRYEEEYKKQIGIKSGRGASLMIFGYNPHSKQ
ncbi:hypothetical protein ABEW33_27280, partial [Priestia megaterium]